LVGRSRGSQPRLNSATKLGLETAAAVATKRVATLCVAQRCHCADEQVWNERQKALVNST
jgi:hypothetical protein